MDKIIEKLNLVFQKLKDKKQKIYLFALFLRPDQDNWDLIISGENISNNLENTKLIIDLLKSNEMTDEELKTISALVILEHDNPFVLAINGIMRGSNNRVMNSNFNNLFIKDAYFIYSNPLG